MSQKDHLEFEDPGALGENLIFQSPWRRVPDI